MAEPRRFPPPWTVEETDACFIVRDHNDQALAYVYFEDEPGRRAAAKLLTRDEARRIAEHVAGPRVTKQPDWQGLPPLIIAEEYLKRALPYRDQAIELPDTVNSRPNWPKHFLIVSGHLPCCPAAKRIHWRRPRKQTRQPTRVAHGC